MSDALRERFGKYHVLEKIAQGGMAEVYKVKTVGIAGFEKIQALKRILPSSAREGRFIRSFIDEARIAVELTHRNIVQVFDFGKADGELFLAMELIEGVDLRSAMGLAVARDFMPSIPVAAYIVSEVAAGLDYAHRKTDGYGGSLGIVHCDVSPSNVMLSAEGYVKILDFGIARATFASALERRRLRGKPRYMAPEQTLGEPPTAAADVFALGIIAWELFTGLPLFRGADLKSILDAVRRTVPPRLDKINPAVPAEIVEAIATALHRDPAQRGAVADLGAACMRTAMLAGARTVAAWMTELDRRPSSASLDWAPEVTSISVPPPGAPAARSSARSITHSLDEAVDHAPAEPATERVPKFDAPSLTAVQVRPPVLPAAAPPVRPSVTQLLSHTNAFAFGPGTRSSVIRIDDGHTVHGMELPPLAPDDTSYDELAPGPPDDDPDDDDERPTRSDARTLPTPPAPAPVPADDPIDDDLGLQPVALPLERRRTVIVAGVLQGAALDVLRLITRGLGELAYQRGGVVIGLDDRALVVAFGLEVAGEDDVAIAMGWALDAAAMVRDAGGDAVVRIGARTGVTTQRPAAPADAPFDIPPEAIDEARQLARDAMPDRPLFVGGAGRLTSALYALREVPAPRRVARRSRVIEVIGPRGFDERDRARLERRGSFVGRSAQLAELDGWFERAVAEDRRICVLIAGAAGTGKSRLVAELLARGPDWVRVVTSAASPAGQLAPFAQIVDLYQAALGLPPARGRAARAQLTQRLRHALGRGDLPAERARAIATDLERAMELRDGVGLGAPEVADLRPRIAAGLAVFRSALADRARPLITVIEDVHLADSASVEVLRHLLGGPATGAELLVLTARPEGQPPPAVDAVVAIGDLAGADLRAMIADRLGDAASPLNIAAVLARGGGNPLFVEELSDAVRAAGRSGEDVPASARDVVSARLEQLSPVARAAVRFAAVLGGTVRVRLLEELLGVRREDDDALARELDELVHAAFLVRPDHGTGAAEGELQFTRGLVREVVYESLSVRAQRDSHARVGRLLASRFFAGREEPPALIAEHLERGGEPAGAAAFWLRAGRLALTASDAPAAVACFTRTLALEAELASGPPQTPTSLARRREALAGRDQAHRLMGDATSDPGDLDALEQLCAGDPRRLADVAIRRAQRMLRLADYAQARAATELAEERARTAGDDRLRGEALRVRGEILERLGHYDDALVAVEAARELFHRQRATHDEMAALIGRGRILLMRADYEAARAAYEPVRAMIAQTGDPWLERIATNHAAVIEVCLGQFERAMASAARSLALCRRYGDRAREGDALSVTGTILLEVGLLDDAARAFADALALLARATSRWSRTDCLIYAGSCEVRRGHFEGLAMLDEAHAEARRLGARYLEANALVARAGAHLRHGNLAGAVDDAVAGSAVAREATLVGAEIQGLARHALALSRMGRAGSAVPLVQRALALLDAQRHIEGSEEEVLAACAEVLDAAGGGELADRVRRRGEASASAKLAALTDPVWRAAYLAVPDIRRLIG